MEEVLRKGVRVDFSRSNQIRNGVVGRQRNSVKPLWYKYSTEPKLLKIQTHHVGPLKTKIWSRTVFLSVICKRLTDWTTYLLTSCQGSQLLSISGCRISLLLYQILPLFSDPLTTSQSLKSLELSTVSYISHFPQTAVTNTHSVSLSFRYHWNSNLCLKHESYVCIWFVHYIPM